LNLKTDVKIYCCRVAVKVCILAEELPVMLSVLELPVILSV